MNSVAKSLFPFRRLRSGGESRSSASRFTNLRPYSAMSEDHKLGDLMDYLEKLKNYERLGVPRGAGTDTDDGFDLGRMRRLMQRLGNPHTNFKAVHIAGTKGKGSTATFLSNILREEGYSVGCYTSPHLLTIRERISLGRNGDHVSVDTLNTLFYQLKGILDQSIELENGALTHFEVFTALAFSTFSQEKVDIAIVEAGLGGARDATNVIRNSELAASVITSIGEEHLSALGGSMESIAVAKSGIIKHGRPLVIGGPFELHIEHIIRDKASSMNSAVISACDPGILSVVKRITQEENELPYQICDIFIQVEDNFKLFIELPDVKLQMLGSHQLKNAVTATCAALGLRDQGWSISDQAIRAGLERSRLMGRSQFLNYKEVESLGLSRATILVDGAHTEASARGIADVIQVANPSGPLALVVAMASDKDHTAFARQLLSGRRPDLVLLTEVDIAGSKSRSTPALALKDSWIRASVELGIEVLDIGMAGCKTFEGCLGFLRGSPDSKKSMMLIGCSDSSIDDTIKVADQLLRYRDSSKSGLIAVTGSLHIAASVLAFVDQ